MTHALLHSRLSLVCTTIVGEDDSEDEQNESGLGNDDQLKAVGVKRSAPESDNITGTTEPSLNDLVSRGDFEIMLKHCIGNGPSRRPCSCHDTDDFDKLKADVEDAKEKVEEAEGALSGMKELAEPSKATKRKGKGKGKGKGKAKIGAASSALVVEAEKELAKVRNLLEKAVARHQIAETRAHKGSVGHNFECETSTSSHAWAVTWFTASQGVVQFNPADPASLFSW